MQVALRLSLFPLLERLGDRYAVLSAAAELTLCRPCAALNNAAAGSISSLLADNAGDLFDTLQSSNGGHRHQAMLWVPVVGSWLNGHGHFQGWQTIDTRSTPYIYHQPMHQVTS